MRPALALALLLAALPAPAAPDSVGPAPAAETPPPAAAAWLGRISRDAPGAFPPPRSFAADYRVTWGSLAAAHVKAACDSPADGPEIRTAVQTSTAGAVRSLYKLDATHLSVISRRTLQPIHLEQTEQGAKRRLAAQVDFDPDGATRTARNSRDKNPPKPQRLPYPGMLDMEGVFLTLRSLPLAVGAEQTRLLMTAGSPYLATLRVVGRGLVKVPAGEYPAIELSLKLEKVSKTGALEPRKGFKSAHAWLSDDADRLLIKAEAEVFVGSVRLELEKVDSPK